MKLFYSATSPYVRKVVACAIARDIDRQIEKIDTNPHVSPPELLAANPLSKVPCLVADDGIGLFDSPVICEYLDTVEGGPQMFPSHGGARWTALRQQAMGDGIMDAAVGRRMEQGKPDEAARNVFMARMKAAVDRSLDMLEHDLPHQLADIGSITIACALGYLDLRFANDAWRTGHPKLAAWYAEFEKNLCVAQTRPPGM